MRLDLVGIAFDNPFVAAGFFPLHRIEQVVVEAIEGKVLRPDLRHDCVATLFDVDELVAIRTNLLARAFYAGIDVAGIGLPEQIGAAQFLELLERIADIAERFELAILRGELRNLYVNRVQVFLELCQLEFRLTNLRL